MPDVVLSPRPDAPSGNDAFLTAADLTAYHPQASEMGCHLPEVFVDERPGVSTGVQMWAFGTIFAFAVCCAAYLLAHV